MRNFYISWIGFNTVGDGFPVPFCRNDFSMRIYTINGYFCTNITDLILRYVSYRRGGFYIRPFSENCLFPKMTLKDVDLVPING